MNGGCEPGYHCIDPRTDLAPPTHPLGCAGALDPVRSLWEIP